MKNLMKIFGLLVILPLLSIDACASNASMTNTDQSRVIRVVEKAEKYIKKYGVETAITEFRKNSNDIFMGDYNGMFYWKQPI